VEKKLPHETTVVWQVGEIISRFECKGFVLKGLKLFQTPEKLAQVKVLSKIIKTPLSIALCSVAYSSHLDSQIIMIPPPD
jgi:nucleoside diphosphate kinase